MKEIVICGENRHEKPTRSRIACRGVMIRDGRILLVHEENRDHWLLPGGGLEDGETLEQCCIREMEEETGMIVSPRQHFLTIHEYYGAYHLTSHYFLCDYRSMSCQHLTDYEAAAGMQPKWIPLEEAMERFAGYEQYAQENAMRRGAYLREYTALQELPV